MNYMKFLTAVTALLILSLTACEREDMFDFAKNGISHKWEYAGTAGISAGAASSISIAVYNDTPYVAYLEASIPKVVKYNGSAWTQVGADLDSVATDIDLTFDGGTPYAVYSSAGGTYVKYYDGSSWITVGTQPSITMTYFNDIIISSGIPYVGYHNGTSTFALKYTAPSWGTIDTSLGGLSDYMSLAATTTQIYASFNLAGVITIMKNTIPVTGTWVPISPAGLNVESISSLIYSGQPAVAFKDIVNSGKASVISYTGSGTAWNNIGTAGFSEGDISYVSMVIFEGTLHVAYRDNFNAENKITAMRYEKGSWVVDDVPRFTPSTVGEVDLAGGSKRMFVAFSDDSVSGRLSVMQY